MTPKDRLWAYEHPAAFVQRLLRGRSLLQVATRTGVDKSTIMRIARGRPPRLETVRAVIEGFDR